MGGDWVLNSRGQGAKLSFSFEKTNAEGTTECYGLTVGHLAANVGDKIFRFAKSKPGLPPGDDGDEEESYSVYSMYQIGEVTSISKDTDSLVFKMSSPNEGEYVPMWIAMSDTSS